MARDVRIGCSGWQYRHWNGTFYPKPVRGALQLPWYARWFDTVEVNSTFYRLPNAEAVARWVADTPDGFCFTIKGSKFITQNKKLRDFGEHAPLLYERIQPLLRSPKMGPVLWQLPEGFKRNHERLEQALAQLPPGRHCFEFRHPSWFVPETFELLRRHGVAHVIGDHVERPYQTRQLTADWTFLRFHYGHEEGTGNYSERELQAWAEWVDGVRADAEVFVYFNNDWECYALHNARRLGELLDVPMGSERTGPPPVELPQVEEPLLL